MTEVADPIIWGDSDKGRQRDHNEDQIYPDSRHRTSFRLPSMEAIEARGHLFVVADGIGGAQVGDTASTFAVRSVVDHYYHDPRQLPPDKLLEAAVKTANTNVYNYVHTSPAFQQAGSTLTAAVIRGSQLIVAHVGDSRAYLIQGDQIYPLTTDHTLDQLRAAGQPLPPSSQPMPGNTLVRSLGGSPNIVVDIGSYQLKPGDTVVLCSDGLHGLVSEDEIRQIASKLPPEKAVRRLISLANRAGGPDNISAIVAQLPDSDDSATGVSAYNVPMMIVGVILVILIILIILWVTRNLGDTSQPDATATATIVAALVQTTGTPVPPATTAATEAVVALALSDQGEAATSPAQQDVTPAAPTPEAASQSSRDATSTPMATEAPTPTPRPPTPTPEPEPTVTQVEAQPTAPVEFPAPILTRPEQATTLRNSVVLTWEPVSGVGDGTTYRIFLETDQPNQAQVEQQRQFDTPSPTLRLNFDDYPDFFSIPGSHYFWQVAVAVPGQDRLLSPKSDIRDFFFQRSERSNPAPTPR